MFVAGFSRAYSWGLCAPDLCACRVDRNKYQIQIPLPPKIDPSVTMMTVEEKPDVTYSDIGGCKEQAVPQLTAGDACITLQP